MRIFSLGLLAGTLCLQQFRHLPEPVWSALALLALVFLLRQYWRKAWLRFLLAGVCGFSWSLIYAHTQMADRLETRWESVDLRVQGYVLDLPVFDRQQRRFTFQPCRNALTDNGQAVRLPEKIRLSWYQTDANIKSGQFLDLTVRLKRPNGFMNPAGFDYETWLYTQGIGALGYVRQAHTERGDALPALAAGPLARVNQWRQALLLKLQHLLLERRNAGLIIALILGERSQIEQQHWRLLQQTGTNHLLAISGLHIGLVAGMIYFLCRRLFALSRFALRVPASKPAALVALVAAFGYAALAGFSLPTQRAIIMLAAFLLAELRQRHYLPSQCLALACSLILLINPCSVLQPGFWLSFLAVASLLLSLAICRRLHAYFHQWIRPQLKVFTGLTLCLIYVYGTLPWLSPLANLLAIPWVSFITVPFSLAALPFIDIAPWFSNLLFNVADHSISWLLGYLEWIEGFHWHWQVLGELSLSQCVFAMFAVVLLLLPPAMPLRWLSVLLFLPLFLRAPMALQPGQFRVAFLDVGQGLSVVIQTQKHVLVYDTGARFSKKFDAASSVIAPYLHQQGVKKIDRLILSHNDVDHMGAAKQLLNQFTTDHVMITWTESYAATQINCDNSQHWVWDGVPFQVLHPRPDTPLSYTDNNHSCVLHIGNDQHGLLLTGDIESKVERELVSEKARLRSELLQVPHHGSRSSSSDAFICAVSPRWAIATTGYRNRYRFPRPQIVERYLQRGIAFLSTSHYGALTFLMDVNHPAKLISAQRVDRQRYWHLSYGNKRATKKD